MTLQQEKGLQCDINLLSHCVVCAHLQVTEFPMLGAEQKQIDI